MRKILFLTIFAVWAATSFAQTIQQAQLLQERINKDNVLIAQDQNQINLDLQDISMRQNDITNLNAEIQGAQAFLDAMSPTENIVINSQSPNIVSTPIYGTN